MIAHTSPVPLVFLALWGLCACGSEKDGFAASSASDGLSIEVTGSEYRWLVRYPGQDGQLETEDDFLIEPPIVLPQGVPVTFVLKSNDYLYGFELPAFEIYEIAVPELTYSIGVTPSDTGSFELLGNQMCGYTHPNLLGEIRVDSLVDFEGWWADSRTK